MDFLSLFCSSRLSAAQGETVNYYQLTEDQHFRRRDYLLTQVKDHYIIIEANSDEPAAQAAEDLQSEIIIGEESNFDVSVCESAEYTLGYYKFLEEGRKPWKEEFSVKEDAKGTEALLETGFTEYSPPVFENLQNKMQIEVESENDGFGYGEMLTTTNILDSDEKEPPATLSSRLLFTCPLKNCPYSYETFKELEEHVEVHLDEQDKPSFFCDVCKTNFFSKEDAMKHIRRRENKECCACENRSPICAQLVEHLRRHTGDKPFICMACSQGFSHPDDLNSHLLTHIVEKNFSCGFCMKRFAKKQHLEVHERTHTGEKPFKCAHCPYRTSDTSNLRKHNLRLHPKDAEEKAFECSYCRKKFAHQGHLRMHIRAHTKEPMSCMECDKKFYDKEWLKKHMKNKHPRVMRKDPYQCKDCIDDFATSWELALHQQQHMDVMAYINENNGISLQSGEKPRLADLSLYPCQECNGIFTTEEYLKSHLKRTHNEDGILF